MQRAHGLAQQPDAVIEVGRAFGWAELRHRHDAAIRAVNQGIAGQANAVMPIRLP